MKEGHSGASAEGDPYSIHEHTPSNLSHLHPMQSVCHL